MLKNFNSENPTAEVCMDAKSIPNGSNGKTRGGETLGNTNPIEININTDLVGQVSKLEFALYIFHELIHAEMWRKIQSVNHTLDPNNFSGLYDYYSRYLLPNSNGSPQHNLMANHYIDHITDALMEFDNNPNDEILRPIYEALAWIGLEETDSWVNKSNVEKQSFITLRTSLVNEKSKCN